MDLRLEAVVIPVSDVDRAKAFYVETPGFRLDVDFGAPTHEAALGFRYGGEASYGSFVTFADPDGNGWLVQEITERAPGR